MPAVGKAAVAGQSVEQGAIDPDTETAQQQKRHRDVADRNRRVVLQQVADERALLLVDQLAGDHVDGKRRLDQRQVAESTDTGIADGDCRRALGDHFHSG